MTGYVTRDGQRLTPWMLRCVNLAATAFRAEFGLDLIVTSGLRTNAEQRSIFLDRYRERSAGAGPYGDVRWWEGRRYVRVSPDGTVAAPGTSNHELQDNRAAVDLRDNGAHAGVTVAGSRRAAWLRKHAHTFGLDPAGYGFGEPWHYEIPDALRTPPAPARPPAPAATTTTRRKEHLMIFAKLPNGITDKTGKRHHLYAIIGAGYYHAFSGDAAAAAFAKQLGEPATVSRSWLDFAVSEAHGRNAGAVNVNVTNADDIGA